MTDVYYLKRPAGEMIACWRDTDDAMAIKTALNKAAIKFEERWVLYKYDWDGDRTIPKVIMRCTDE